MIVCVYLLFTRNGFNNEHLCISLYYTEGQQNVNIKKICEIEEITTSAPLDGETH